MQGKNVVLRTANASMLQFHISQTIKFFLITVCNQSKRIPESQGLLDTQFILKGGQLAGRPSLRDRGKGRSSRKEGSNETDGSLHGGVTTGNLCWDENVEMQISRSFKFQVQGFGLALSPHALTT